MDEITKSLRDLKSNLPEPRTLSDSEKEALIIKLGVNTTKSLIKAKKTLPIARIPFLFSSIDAQWIVDILGNDMEIALQNVIEGQQNSNSTSPKK